MSLRDNKYNKSQHARFLELLTPNYYKIHSFILTLVLNKADAEDVLQSSISYMWEHFEDFKPGTNFLSWSFTISKFHVLTYRKKQQRSKVYLSDKALELVEIEDRRLSKEMDARYDALENCIKKLSDKDLTFVKKRFDKRMSIKDIALEIGMSVGVAYKRLSRIKNLLLNCIRQTIASEELL